MKRKQTRQIDKNHFKSEHTLKVVSETSSVSEFVNWISFQLELDWTEPVQVVSCLRPLAAGAGCSRNPSTSSAGGRILNVLHLKCIFKLPQYCVLRAPTGEPGRCGVQISSHLLFSYHWKDSSYLPIAVDFLQTAVVWSWLIEHGTAGVRVTSCANSILSKWRRRTEQKTETGLKLVVGRATAAWKRSIGTVTHISGSSLEGEALTYYHH